jgi:hypothetical protein
MEVVRAQLEQVAEKLEPLRAPGPPVLRAGPLPFAFAFRSRFSLSSLTHPREARMGEGPASSFLLRCSPDILRSVARKNGFPSRGFRAMNPSSCANSSNIAATRQVF